MVKAVVFDLDGTLIDTVGGIWRLYQEVSLELGLPEKSYEEFCSHLGKTWNKVLVDLWPGIDVEDFKKHYDISREKAERIPGVNKAVKALSGDYLLAVLTSRDTDTTRMHAEATGLDLQAFNKIYGRDNTKHHKPDGRVFREVGEDLGLKYDEFIYVGDSLVDYQATLLVEVPFVGVLTGAAEAKSFEREGVDYVDSVRDIPDYLDSIF